MTSHKHLVLYTRSRGAPQRGAGGYKVGGRLFFFCFVFCFWPFGPQTLDPEPIPLEIDLLRALEAGILSLGAPMALRRCPITSWCVHIASCDVNLQ